MKRRFFGLLLLGVLAVVLQSCGGAYVKPIADYHLQQINTPASGQTYANNTGMAKPWAVGQYVKYLTPMKDNPQVSEFAIVGKEGDNAYWVEIRFTGLAWGYKALLELTGNSPMKSTDFMNQKYKVLKASYYKLDTGKNEWIESSKKNGLDVTYILNFGGVANIMTLIMGYDAYGISYVDIGKDPIDMKVVAGNFLKTISLHYSAMVDIGKNRDVHFYLHSAIPIFGAARFDSFYYSVDLLEFREDFKGSLFDPYPVNIEKK